MAEQVIFQRYELKYRITREQKRRLVAAMEPYMEPDVHGRTTIRNLYFDTDSYRLIRRSLEKPSYKEKLRLRSYSQAGPQSPVFVELKKKYRGVVYKRRLALPEAEAMRWVCGGLPCDSSQIAGEVDYFLAYYGTLHPTVFLSYEREAWQARDGGDFRVTFDEQLLCRREELSLEAEVYGRRLLPEDEVLLELKCSGGLPLWMTRLLSRERIYQTSFSKYGTAYLTMIYPECQEVV